MLGHAILGLDVLKFSNLTTDCTTYIWLNQTQVTKINCSKFLASLHLDPKYTGTTRTISGGYSVPQITDEDRPELKSLFCKIKSFIKCFIKTKEAVWQ